MQHLDLKATTTATDQELGHFEALASAWVADRQGDVIERGAFDRTIEAWQRSGKQLPLLAEHSTSVVGTIDPHSMHASEDGLVVAGQVDRETAEGQQAWKMIKAGSAGFSIGFMSESKPRKGGGRTITEIDLLEISVTGVPVHQSTRTLSWKSADVADREHENIAAAFAQAFSSKPDLADLTIDQLKSYADELTKDIETRPVRVASFDC